MTHSMPLATESAVQRQLPEDPSLADLNFDERALRQQTLFGRTMLLIGAAASVVICLSMARFFSIPREPDFSISLLQQPNWFATLFAVSVAGVASIFVAGIITRWIRPEAALLCGGIGLTSISTRGGTMQATLFAAGGAGVFIQLAFEVVILFAILAIGWWAFKKAVVTNGEPMPPNDELWLAIFADAAVMTALMLLVCRSDAKMQTIIGVGLCAAVATFVARQIVTVQSLGWLWISPLIVALLGYLLAWMHPQTLQIGVLHGAFAPLARPLPLEYAGMGAAGTVVGYWMGGTDGVEDVEAEEV